MPRNPLLLSRALRSHPAACDPTTPFCKCALAHQTDGLTESTAKFKTQTTTHLTTRFRDVTRVSENSANKIESSMGGIHGAPIGRRSECEPIELKRCVETSHLHEGKIPENGCEFELFFHASELYSKPRRSQRTDVRSKTRDSQKSSSDFRYRITRQCQVHHEVLDHENLAVDCCL